jgi:predicted dehydrogenase
MLDERVELVAVADHNEDRAAVFASEHGGGCNSYRTQTELLERHKDVDVSFVCVPDEFHAAVTIEALNRGVKAVLCEKPPATNVDEVRSMVATAVTKSGLLYWGFLYFHMLHHIWPFLNEATLGEVPLAFANWDRRRGAPTWRPGGKGPFFDLACHLYPIVWKVMGSPRPLRISGKAWDSVGKLARVNLIGPADPETFDTPDTTHAIIDFDDDQGSRIDLKASFMGNVPVEEAVHLTILGAKKGASVPLVAGARDPRETLATLNWEEELRLLSSSVDRPLPRTVEEGFYAQVAHLIDCLDGRGKVFVTGAEAIEVQRMLDGFALSVTRGGEFVSLTD